MAIIKIKQTFLCLALLIAVLLLLRNQNSIKKDQFSAWKAIHKIQYEGQLQNSYRRRVFQENYLKMIKHNSNLQNTYSIGLNQFSAMTDQEIKKQLLFAFQVQTPTQVLIEQQFYQAKDIDWSQKGAVGPVKNQGQCSAAWVFSTTGPLQGLNKILSGKFQNLSDQQLIDCASPSGSGCQGGFPGNGFKFVKQHGISTAEQYPYKGVYQTCKKADGSFKISGYTEIKSSCSDLSTAIQKGPVSVLVDATNWARYSSGVFNNCGSQLNHAVTLVGQIQQNWKVKNSWSSSWGEMGYIRLAKGNTCGICSNGIIPFK